MKPLLLRRIRILGLSAFVMLTSLIPTAAADDDQDGDITQCVEAQDASNGGIAAGGEGSWAWINFEDMSVHVFVPTGGIDEHGNFYGTEVIITCTLDCLTDNGDPTDCIPD